MPPSAPRVPNAQARIAVPDLESIAVVGLLGELEGRAPAAADLALLTIPRAERERRLPAIAAAMGAAELVYLATCNRVELIFRRAASDAALEPGATREHELAGRALELLSGGVAGAVETARLAGAVGVLRGERAVRHLFEVAAGLDSAQLGEREIQGQLRDALAEARRAGIAGAGAGLVPSLVEEALRVARRIHLETELGAGRVSLAEIAGELLLERVRRTPSAVALVGVTPMTRRAAEILERERVPYVMVNRTPARAEAVVAELGAGRRGSRALGRALSLDEFCARPPRVEAVLTATAAPEAVLDRATLERLAAVTPSQEPPLVIDLALPPDVDREAASAAEIQLVDLDEIQGVARGQRESRQAAAAAARALIGDAIAGLGRRLAERALAPWIARINQRYHRTALEGVERLLAKRGLALEGEAREAVERWAETLARRFAHLPTLGLRALAAEHGMAAVESFLAACDLDALAGPVEGAELEELLAALELERDRPS